MSHPAIVTCALTGVLTDPARHGVPVTPEEMAAAAREARDAGASIVHVHFRRQEAGRGHLPSWDPNVAAEICDAIRTEVPDLLLNLSTGVLGPDISGPVACLERVRPEMAALNAGTLNYLKTRSDGRWAWPPMLFDNPVEKIEAFVDAMIRSGTVPEFECFDTGILRSVGLFFHNGLAGRLTAPAHISLVMGVASGMPADPRWLPLLLDQMPEGAHWQSVVIGRQEVWDVHQRTAELGGNLRTGLEDTFYLPDGSKTASNGALIEALVAMAEQAGRTIATPEEARAALTTVAA